MGQFVFLVVVILAALTVGILWKPVGAMIPLLLWLVVAACASRGRGNGASSDGVGRRDA